MAQLSWQLWNRLNSVGGRQTERVPVVVRLKTEVSDTVSIGRLSETEINGVRNTLAAAGVRGDVLLSKSFAPRCVAKGDFRVGLNVSRADLATLKQADKVEYVRLERIHRMHLDVSVGLLGVDNSEGASVTGKGIKVAVIDSGIDKNHPDFDVSRIIKYRNFSGEGALDDVSDTIGHGTHVAGIIGGNGATYRGVAPEVELIVCKVFSADGRAREVAIQEAVDWAVEEGAQVINYSGGFSPVEFHPTIGPIALVTPPWVLPFDSLAEEAVFEHAMDTGVVCVVSAGNHGLIGQEGTIAVPATSEAVISVGAAATIQRLSRFSSGGPVYRSKRVPHEEPFMTLSNYLSDEATPNNVLDLVAPGGEVTGAPGGIQFRGIVSALSAEAEQVDRTSLVLPRYQRICGTSQAAPHIAGLAALVLQRAEELKINLATSPGKAYNVKNILLSGARPLRDDTPRSRQGNGIPQWAAIEQAMQDMKRAQIAQALKNNRR